MSAITAFVVTTLQLVLLPFVAVFALLAHLITFPLDSTSRVASLAAAACDALTRCARATQRCSAASGCLRPSRS